jgi:S-adenosylmethionine decarboxylase
MNNPETCNFGVHLMVDGYGADPVKLSSREVVTKFLEELPDKLGMHKIIEPVIEEFEGNDIKDPGGFSGFVMIAESHISIHTFPARKFVSIDVYTCKSEMDKDFVLNYLKEMFNLSDMEVNYVNRGTKYPLQNIA